MTDRGDMLQYDYLVLCALFMIPLVIMVLIRPDLLKTLKWVVALSIPFAFTEPLFYLDYWEPVFLFDLGPIMGFGIEDFIFLGALGAGAFSTYPVLTCKGIAFKDRSRFHWKGAISVLAATCGLLAVTQYLNVSLIWSVICLMVIMSCIIAMIRRDLVSAALIGGAGYGLIYWVLFLLFACIYPNAFETVWHTDKISNVFVAGVPLEEVAYGIASGTSAAVCIPFMLNFHYKQREAS